MTNEEVVNDVTAHIESALLKNRRIETLLLVLLTTICASGLGLIWVGILTRQWAFALPGSICEFAAGFPILSLVRLRQENIRLAIVPQIIRLADNDSRKKLVFQLVERLISQIGQ